MFPAARLLDPITHDMLVPSGIIGPQAPAPCPFCPSAPVIIEGMPAAHVMCTSVCSGAISAGIAHPPIPIPPAPPPPILKGSLTVFIHGMPALRWSPALDITSCGAFLGDPKLAAMRRVLIGDVGMGAPGGGAPGAGGAAAGAAAGAGAGAGAGAPPFTLPSNIVIVGTPEFQQRTRGHLIQIASTPTGRALLESIGRSGQTVTIRQTAGGNGASPVDGSRAVPNADGTPGPGTGTNISYNPDRTQVGDGSQPWHNRPPAVGLAHELMHANHNANGTNDFTQRGEDMVVGNPPYDSEPITENRVRSEWHPPQPQRTEY